MNNLTLKVVGNRLEMVRDGYSTSGSVNYDSCTFSFDSEWSTFEKTAVFGFGNDDVLRVALDENNTCKIPAVCMQKEGYIRIGVYGINGEETVITTNCVAHRVDEGADDIGDWFEEDSSIVFNALAELETALEAYKQGLDKRFDSLADSLNADGGAMCVPSDWYVPQLITDAENMPAYSKNSSYNDYLNYKLNRLVADYPDYASSICIGMDESGEYPIYAYIFEPQNYEKTVFVSSCIEGAQASSVLAVSCFLDDLCRNCREDRTLGYLRSRVKLVVLPVGNPYGMMHNSQYNANGVRIDRNFDYRWSECKDTHKGSSAADCQETAAIQTLLQTISTDKLCAVVNFKDQSNMYSGKMLFYPRFKNNCIDELTKLLYRYNYEEKNESDLLSQSILAPTMNPTLVNYAAEVFGVNACTVNWPSLSYGGVLNNVGITKFTELVGNVLFTVAKNSTFTLRGTQLPFTKYFSWRGSDEDDVFVIPKSGSLKKAPITAYQLALRAPCNVTANGYAIIRAESDCNICLNPLLWQNNCPEQTYNERLAMQDFAIEIPLRAGTHVIPFDSVLQGCYSDNNEFVASEYPEKLCFALGLCADKASTAKLAGFSVTLNAFASDIGRSVEITRPMGMAGDYTSENDVPTQSVVYPKEALYADENRYYD
ncbi:MAG: DUF2817 domain-containing protein [Clostridia bacterium]|nr:DUF2817 domain-containing protein [Clostridia bacterium]